MSDLLSWLVPAASIGTSIYGAVQNNRSAQTQANALQQAAAQQQQSGDNALNFLRYAYDQSRADTQPWRQAGAQALGQASGQFGGPFEETPGYRFAFNEGLRAINNGMAARGLSNSTAAGRALARYGAGAASQEYGNYANRLMALAGLGQTSAGQGAAAAQGFGQGAAGVAQNTGNALAGLTAGQGAVQAQGANAGANAIMGGANNLLGYWAMANNPFARKMPA